MAGTSRILRLAVVCLLAAAPAAASFHLMQIEQALGGVCGNPEYQAIQLRMRAAGQELVAGKQIKAWDALGANPVVLITIPTNVAGQSLGSRILITTSALASAFAVTPDFTFTQRIPDSYLRAGRLTWEDGFGTVYWSLAWGGGAYVGATTGDTINDVDGNFGPPSGGRLPFNTASTLQFQGAAGDPSTTNAANYAASGSPASLVNNAGAAKLLPPCVFGDGFVSGDNFAWSNGAGFEYCNGIDDDGDIAIDEDFPLGDPCPLPPPGGTGSYVCAPDGRGVVCSP